MKPVGISMLKVDSNSRPLQEICYHRGNCEIKHDDIVLNDEVKKAIEYLCSTNSDEYTAPVGEEYISVFLLQQDRRSLSFLIVRFTKRVSKAESYHIKGMVDIYRNFTQLLLDSQTDELTGLANRKTFDEAVDKVYEMHLPETEDFPGEQRHETNSNESSPYWLALVDIDHFKKINDNFGHLYGDEVLVLLAQLMKTCFREDDLLFRFGGEEFVIILKSPTKDTSSIALERFRKTIEDTEFPGVGKVTISLGATEMIRGIFHVTLLDYADQSLYYSKNNGRNCLTFFDELVDKGEAKLEQAPAGEVDLF